ncbi:hypothetical protein [Gramella sp. KN1008]|uniref:hypothetical protein n=1 Tax=Gramella sp. KN1008 TaxID=2529298 RepID=UPI00103E4D54|nr:hypothetical protein [Gramella sp. KN1008]TBW26543.1 hypothetical protein EZJ28_14160 [Gramella sp. KN1008]
MKILKFLILALFLFSHYLEAQSGTEKNEKEFSDYTSYFQKQWPENYWLTNVYLINGSGVKQEGTFNILIDDGFIKKVISTRQKIESSEKVFDYAGHTVIPGIVRVHNHMRLPQGALLYSSPKLYLAGGVTTIQTCGTGNPDEELAISQYIERGEQPGPRIINSSPYFLVLMARRTLFVLLLKMLLDRKSGNGQKKV